MKKFFSSSGGSDHQSSFVGKTFLVGGCQCIVEEVIAEGMSYLCINFLGEMVYVIIYHPIFIRFVKTVLTTSMSL